MICVSKVVKFDIYPCGYLDSNPSNDIILPCLNDFERVVRRINAYVPDRYIVKIWVPVEVFGVCVCRYGRFPELRWLGMAGDHGAAGS